MRENRTSGSVRGALGNRRSYRENDYICYSSGRESTEHGFPPSDYDHKS
jgi:hypothetical protein